MQTCKSVVDYINKEINIEKCSGLHKSRMQKCPIVVDYINQECKRGKV